MIKNQLNNLFVSSVSSVSEFRNILKKQTFFVKNGILPKKKALPEKSNRATKWGIFYKSTS